MSDVTKPAKENAIERLDQLFAQQFQWFWACGKLLTQIRDEKLFEDLGYENFTAFCLRHTEISRAQIYRLIEAARVMNSLEGITPLPRNESSIRPLTSVQDKAKIRQIWLEAIRSAAGGTVTCEHVLNAITHLSEGSVKEQEKGGNQ